MLGFKPWISHVGTDRRANCATTTVQKSLNVKQVLTHWYARGRNLKLHIEGCGLNKVNLHR